MLRVNGTEGVNVAVVALYITAPEIEIVPFFRVKVAEFTVDAVKVSLKVAVTAWFSPAPVDVSAGLTDETVGGVISGAAPVVNVHVYVAAIALPNKSLTPLEMEAV